MSDLISRQAAIDEAEEWIEAVYCDREEQRERSAIKKVIQGIKYLPSAQPEIIYCKDCKYWKRSSCCEGYCGEIDMEGFDEDHYCGFAERREVTT